VGKIQTGRFERLGARTYSIKGPGALVDLDETVLGVVQLERQAGIEAHYIQEWETFGINIVRASSGGEFSYVLLSNPVGSNRLIVFDMFMRQGSNATTQMKMFISRGVPPGFSASTVATPLDTRIPISRQPAGRMFTDASSTASFGIQIMQPATAEFQPYQVVLGPDGSLIWGTAAHAQELIMAVRWAERDAAPFEL